MTSRNLTIALALTTTFFSAGQAAADLYCKHVGRSTVKCVGNVDCGDISLGDGDSCFELIANIPDGAIMLDGDAGRELLRDRIKAVASQQAAIGGAKQQAVKGEIKPAVSSGKLISASPKVSN